MKVITLISGGDSGGAKTHVHSLLQNLSRTIEVTMVCFLEGPFAQEARELGIPTVVLSGRNLLRTYRTLKRMIREGGYQLIHCHGARGNMMGALLRRSTGLPVVTTVHSDYSFHSICGMGMAEYMEKATSNDSQRVLIFIPVFPLSMGWQCQRPPRTPGLPSVPAGS